MTSMTNNRSTNPHICTVKGVVAWEEDARCMTDIIRVCSACHGDGWDPRYEETHPPFSLPDGITLFDTHATPNGSTLYFLDCPWGRSTLVIAPGDDQVGRFRKLLEATMKSKMCKEDKKELAMMGKKGFIAHEKADIKAAKVKKAKKGGK